MKKYYFIFAFVFFTSSAFSQQIHTYAEIVKMLNESKLNYEITQLDKVIECKDYSDNLNSHDCYRISTGSGLTTYDFHANEKAAPLFEKAENFFKSNNTDSALVYYTLALDVDSSLYNVMTYIGQIYSSKGAYATAITWYKKALSRNYIDYMAHWFLADAYFEIEDFRNAVDEIAVAQILNRNDRRIKGSMTKIFERVGRNTQDWCFNPQGEFNKIDDSRISVALDQQWLGYGMAKALWMYEPGYRESMGVTKGYFSTLEEKECLTTLIAGLDNTRIQPEPQLRILKAAAEKKHLEDYILYETVLPETPAFAFQLPEKTMLEIKDYILDIRNSK